MRLPIMVGKVSSGLGRIGMLTWRDMMQVTTPQKATVDHIHNYAYQGLP